MSRRRHAGLGGAGLTTGVTAWASVHEIGGLAGLGASAVLGLAVVPVVAVFAWFGPVAALGACVPRSWRAGHRWRHGRDFCRSARIPARIRRAVLAADRHRCVFCGLRDGLQIDHVMPWSQGGLTSLFNLMVLCSACNRAKSDYWRRRSGRVSYHPFEGYDYETRAGQILDAERLRRLNPLRWWRAAVTI